jgi:hypothetical protein
MASDLTAWKARTYDLMRDLDKLEAIEKQPVSKIRSIYTLIDELEGDIDSLKKECPAEWSGSKGDIEKKTARLKEAWEDLALYASKEAPYNA